MIIIGMVGVVLIGATAIGDTQQQADTQRVEHTMTLFDSRTALVALGSAQSQTIPLPQSGGTYQTYDDTGWMRVVVENTTTGNVEVIANVTLGSIIYEGEDTVIAYQGGGVWRQDRGNQTRMVSPPEFHYQDATLTLPIISIEGGTSVSGGALSVQRNGTADQVYPNATTDDVNPVQNGQVTVTVHSEYYQGWADYFEDRTDGNASYENDQNIANITLTTPSERETVNGGIVSGTPGTELEVDQNSEADSYDSSVGPYSSTQSDDTEIVVAGDVTVYNNGIIDGNLRSGGDVDLQNNAEVHGDISYGGSYSAHHTSVVTGDVTSDAAIETPESVGGLIDQRVGDIQSSNDNSDHSASITDIETEQCGTGPGGCNLTAGQYYLNTVDMEGSLEFDTTGGDITVVVDGDVDLGNGAVWDVEGTNRINLYMEGDIDFDNGAQVQVPGDRSRNFWFYMNPDSSADIKNNAEVNGVVYGPGSASEEGVDVDVDQNAHVYGAVVGDIDNLDQNYNIHYDEALKNAEVIPTDESFPVVTYLHVSQNRVNVTAG